MTLAQLIAQIRAQMATALNERNNNAIRLAELRGADTPDEGEITRLRDANVAIDAQIDQQQARCAELEAELARDNAALGLAAQFNSAPVDAPMATRTWDANQPARVTSEERTYTKRKFERGEAKFLADAWNSRRGNIEATERIERHAHEVMVEGEMTARALSTGGIAGLTIPQYLIDMAAPILRSGRPLANSVNRHQIPDQGMSLIVPRGTTGNSAAEQASENTAVSSTDEVWTNLTVPVVTVSGQQPVSRQTLERGETMDDIIFGDLVRAYAARIDFLCIQGSGSSGQPLGILNTSGIGAATAFGAAAAVANTELKIAGAITTVTSAGAGLYPKVLYMHPRRWGWMTGLVDASNRPIVEADAVGPHNALALINAPGGYGGDDDPVSGLTIIGTHRSGLPVITDLNIPTNVGTNSEDLILAADAQELHLWEDGAGMPKQLSFEQTAGGSLTTTLVVYDYIAFTAGRYPAAVAKVGGLDASAGNGLIAPTF